MPPEQTVTFGIGTSVKLAPPVKLTLATSPRAPPFDQRSCWKMPTTLLVLVRLTSIQGSTSLFKKTVPDCEPIASAVQPRNGLVPEAWTSGPGIRSLAPAMPTTIVDRSASPVRAAPSRFPRIPLSLRVAEMSGEANAQSAQPPAAYDP